MGKKENNNFIMQGAILAISSIIVRLIGVFYRVPLNNILGEKGIAYYAEAYEIYTIFLLISSYSLPLAVSKMVSRWTSLKQYKNTRRILICSVSFGAILGGAAFAATFFGADLFAGILNYPPCAIALKVLSPALLIMSILGVARGYFQGLGTMVPTAISNIFEQIVNAIVSIVAAKALYSSALTMDTSKYTFKNVAEAYGAAGGTLGTVSGAAAALIFMIVLFILYSKTFKRQIAADNNTNKEPIGKIITLIVVTILPVILSTTVYNVSGLIDTGVFSNMMAAKGMSSDLIDTYTGMFTGNYRLIINVPVAIASALASSLIPSVVKSRTIGTRGQVIRKVESSIRVIMIVAMPCAIGIGILAKPIINLLFPTSVDPDKVALMLMVGCVSVVLYSLSTITNSILQGIDKMSIPVRNSAISLGIHVLLLALMILVLPIDIFCVVIADVFFTLIVCVLNALSLKKYLGFRQEKFKTFVLPAACSVIMGVAAYFIYLGIYKLTVSNLLSILVTIIVAALVYAVLLLKLNVVDEDEISSLPKGTKLVFAAKKLHLMK